jgi:hypothetical protein
MKPDKAPQVGVVDALTAGLTQAGRRPALILIPALADLFLWLAPRLSVDTLLQQLGREWESLAQAVYTPAQLATMADMLAAFRAGMTQLGSVLNLAEALTGAWLAPPSVLSLVQGTRMTFISDLMLAPLGLGLPLSRLAPAPWQAAPIQVTSLGAVFLLVVGLWLIGQLLVAFYLRWAATGWSDPFGGSKGGARPASTDANSASAAPAANGNKDGTPGFVGGTAEGAASAANAREQTAVAPASRWAGWRGLLGLTVRLTSFSLLLGLLVFLLRLPLVLALVLTMFSAGNAAMFVALLFGGLALWMLLWFLLSFYFVSEAVVLDQQPLWKGILQSVALVRSNLWATLGLGFVVNLLMWGFRAIWGFVGGTPTGAVVGILGNAYLATGMLLAIFIFYRELCRRWQTQLAAARRKQGKPANGR